MRFQDEALGRSGRSRPPAPLKSSANGARSSVGGSSYSHQGRERERERSSYFFFVHPGVERGVGCGAFLFLLLLPFFYFPDLNGGTVPKSAAVLA